MNERRNKRSDKLHEAVSLYLDAVRRRTGLSALALTTDDGDFVAGSGDLDVEWMGSLGATRRLRTLEWNDQTLHVSRLSVNEVPMVLTAAGPYPPDQKTLATIQRILEN